jgi:hypothetical protein
VWIPAAPKNNPQKNRSLRLKIKKGLLTLCKDLLCWIAPKLYRLLHRSIWEGSFMTLHTVGFVMNQYGWKPELPDNFQGKFWMSSNLKIQFTV